MEIQYRLQYLCLLIPLTYKAKGAPLSGDRHWVVVVVSDRVEKNPGIESRASDKRMKNLTASIDTVSFRAKIYSAYLYSTTDAFHQFERAFDLNMSGQRSKLFHYTSYCSLSLHWFPIKGKSVWKSPIKHVKFAPSSRAYASSAVSMAAILSMIFLKSSSKTDYEESVRVFFLLSLPRWMRLVERCLRGSFRFCFFSLICHPSLETVLQAKSWRSVKGF